MSEVRWLLVGAGNIATRRVAPALVEVANSELVAVCDTSKSRATELAERFNVDGIYTDYAKALTESGADAVYIATPQHMHIELCLLALAAGKHFLCEKPLGLNGAECMPLLDAARKSDRVTSCSNYRRHSEQCKLTDAMLKRGDIGKFVGGWGVYSEPFFNPGKAVICRANGSSRIKELGFYLIDIVQNFFGMPCSVMTQAGLVMNKELMNDVEELATVALKFPGGQIFTLVFNCCAVKTRHEMEFFGSEGSIQWREWPPHGNGPVIKKTRAGTEEFDAHTRENWHLPMIEDYVDALLIGRAPVCSLESAVRTEIITDAIFRSMDSGKKEAILWEAES